MHGNICNEECGIREVWASNLDEELKALRRVSIKYPMVAMDTEFPGVVARPIGAFKSTTDYQYQLLKCNVCLLKLIQVGLTFMNEKGQLPPDYSTWQFNFKFSLGGDMFAQDSIDLLKTSGLQFARHEEDGIEPLYFAEVLMTSGLVLNEEVTWLSFHSGYDFGYLLKLLTNTDLPNDESEFFELLKVYFPKVYDVKYLMKSCRYLKGGLQEVADQLEVQRIGPQHQAGSDSLLTGLTFFRMKEMFFEDNMDESRYCGYLYGLGLSYNGDGPANASISAVEGGHGVILNPSEGSASPAIGESAAGGGGATLLAATGAPPSENGDQKTDTSSASSSVTSDSSSDGSSPSATIQQEDPLPGDRGSTAPPSASLGGDQNSEDNSSQQSRNSSAEQNGAES